MGGGGANLAAAACEPMWLMRTYCSPAFLIKGSQDAACHISIALQSARCSNVFVGPQAQTLSLHPVLGPAQVTVHSCGHQATEPPVGLKGAS